MIHHSLSVLLHLLIVLLLNHRLKSDLLLDWSCSSFLDFNLLTATNSHHYLLLSLDLSLIIPELALVLSNILVALPFAVGALVPILTTRILLILIDQTQYVKCAKWGHWRYLHIFKFLYILQHT